MILDSDLLKDPVAAGGEVSKQLLSCRPRAGVPKCANKTVKSKKKKKNAVDPLRKVESHDDEQYFTREM